MKSKNIFIIIILFTFFPYLIVTMVKQDYLYLPRLIVRTINRDIRLYATQDGLYLRNEPSINSQNNLILSQNIPLEPLNEPEKIDSFNWIKVKVPFGISGWIPKEVTSDHETQYDDSKSLAFSIEKRNLHKYPSINAEIIRESNKNEIFVFSGRKVENNNFTWFHGKTSDEIEFWVVKKNNLEFISFEQKAITENRVNPSTNNVESIPGLNDSELVGICRAGCKAYGEVGSATYNSCVYCCTHDCEK